MWKIFWWAVAIVVIVFLGYVLYRGFQIQGSR